jgi:hypothetical protein
VRIGPTAIGPIVYTNHQVLGATVREAFWVSKVVACLLAVAFDNGSKAELLLAGFVRRTPLVGEDHLKHAKLAQLKGRVGRLGHYSMMLLMKGKLELK